LPSLLQGKCWVAPPPQRLRPPKAIVHFLGGAFVSGAPQVCGMMQACNAQITAWERVARKRTHIHTHTHSYTHTWTRTCTCACVCAHTNTLTYIYTYTHICTRTSHVHAHAHTCAHTCTHTHALAHTACNTHNCCVTTQHTNPQMDKHVCMHMLTYKNTHSLPFPYTGVVLAAD
jgi:hypothetical protein